MKIPFRRTLSIALPLVVCALLWFAVSATAQQKAPKTKAELAENHLGTWKLVSTKYGNAPEFQKYPDRSSRLKLITSTHFTWLEVDAATRKVLASAGGRYTLSGNDYTETIDFAGDGMESYLGKAQNFTIKVDGDKLFQSGELSDGLKIEENWERVK